MYSSVVQVHTHRDVLDTIYSAASLSSTEKSHKADVSG